MISNPPIKNMKVSKKLSSTDSSKNIVEKLNKKTFLLQYLPSALEYLESDKYINYKSEKLKTAYLIDIIHNMVLKYYFKKENKFVINATILKDKYGYLYNYYINYLIEVKIIKMVSNYKKGVSSRKYSLNGNIIKSKIQRRYRNTDKVLLKKYKKKVMDSIDFSDNDDYLIGEGIREKLISDLFSVDIQFDRAIFFLDALKDEKYDVYNRNVYSVECVNDKHIFYHFDNYGRMHTNFTILRSFIRKNCLLIDGEETCEIDIKNSQPLFLSKLIKDSGTKWVKEEEFELFRELTLSGNYYQYMMNVLGIKNRNEAKELTYKVLFGRNITSSKADIGFRKAFPTIHNFIKLYKKDNGNYKMMAYDLQKAESNLIFNRIIKRVIDLYPEIKMITVHDSIVFPKKYKDIVNDIFEQEIENEFNLTK
mgnify:FL=1|jgi:hypothetical protein